jgi:hypothetical protein
LDAKRASPPRVASHLTISTAVIDAADRLIDNGINTYAYDGNGAFNANPTAERRASSSLARIYITTAPTGTTLRWGGSCRKTRLGTGAGKAIFMHLQQ